MNMYKVQTCWDKEDNDLFRFNLDLLNIEGLCETFRVRCLLGSLYVKLWKVTYFSDIFLPVTSSQVVAEIMSVYLIIKGKYKMRSKYRILENTCTKKKSLYKSSIIKAVWCWYFKKQTNRQKRKEIKTPTGTV